MLLRGPWGPVSVLWEGGVDPLGRRRWVAVVARSPVPCRRCRPFCRPAAFLHVSGALGASAASCPCMAGTGIRLGPARAAGTPSSRESLPRGRGARHTLSQAAVRNGAGAGGVGLPDCDRPRPASAARPACRDGAPSPPPPAPRALSVLAAWRAGQRQVAQWVGRGRSPTQPLSSPWRHTVGSDAGKGRFSFQAPSAAETAADVSGGPSSEASGSTLPGA